MKANRIARFKYVARINFGESFVIYAQHLCVAAVGHSGGDPKLAFAIEDPAGYAIGVLTNQSAFAA